MTAEYLRAAAPGTGRITYDAGYTVPRHAAEIETAQWLHNHLGGDIVLLQETGKLYEKTPDYLWNGKFWELKNTTTEKAADSALRSALKQISENPGGVILNYGEHPVSMDRLAEVLQDRLKRQKTCTADILVISKGQLAAALRYKK